MHAAIDIDFQWVDETKYFFGMIVVYYHTVHMEEKLPVDIVASSAVTEPCRTSQRRGTAVCLHSPHCCCKKTSRLETHNFALLNNSNASTRMRQKSARTHTQAKNTGTKSKRGNNKRKCRVCHHFLIIVFVFILERCGRD